MRTTLRDRAWLERIYRAHHRHVLAYAVRRVRPDEADDVVAEVFATAWRHREVVPDEALPWLYRTAGNHILHARRGEARRGRLTSRIGAETQASPYDAVDAAVDAHAVIHAVLAELPEADAEILRLAAWEELDATGIAAVLGCTPGAARTRLHRARRRAENILTRLEPTPEPTLVECRVSGTSELQGDQP